MKPFSVYPCIRQDKPLKSGNYPIYLRIMVMGKDTKIPTGYDTSIKLWDNKAKLPKNNPLRAVIGKLKSEIETHLCKEIAADIQISIQTVRHLHFNESII